MQQQAAQIRDTEKADVVGWIKEAIAYYGITAAELGLGGKVGKSRKPTATVAGPYLVRFRPQAEVAGRSAGIS